ncbi:MAG: hypothetical protein ING90_04850 [Rhodocyclaceae bacterium]|jgi:hypothetical protein|nr:hypothetical protein [Rhodocyclaceae bacterium]MCE2980618.1 hypothetical protein [Betaproteobacteria bacterium]MCA3073082.1 hypothetical protein [Rhodocyclaceae bacterium]MCA3091501.1 hypothetical protein [Rhodocyclaceae bacterium]MCA3094023.1 hypothetical protein [Rhodocyclaceae bacterium]
MATIDSAIGEAPYCMMITFEIDPKDEAEFNDIYDNDHVPNIMKLPGVTEVLRFREAEANAKGFLVYTAVYMMATENLHLTSEWTVLSDLGRWAPVIRPKVKSRTRSTGPVIARFRKTARG